MITQNEIVGMTYIKSIPQIGRTYRCSEEEVEVQNRYLIDDAIIRDMDYQHKYFDKYGNEFELSEIIKNKV